MNDSENPLLMDHEVDGIRELDNKLPRWWVYLFYGTTIFAAIYLVYFHVLGAGDLMAAQYRKEMEVGNAIKTAAMGKFEARILTLDPAKDAAILKTGQKTFLDLCSPCHAKDGGGLAGPNLCDDYWIHGDKFSDNLRTIWNGVPEKGMITWKNYLQPDQIFAVASYIYTLLGTHPKNPKLPENIAPKQTGPSAFE